MLAAMRISAVRWAELVEAWEGSGRTATSFAVEHGITETTLRWWKTELARRARKQIAATRAPGGGRLVPPVALARIVREGEVTPSTPERIRRSVEVVVGGARVVVGAGFDAQLLRDVIRALSERA